jgi:ubiquinone/menaquinone biosynthesis C-methylase UbiE
VLLFNYSTIVDPILKDIRICVAELSSIKAGDRVLDVGCGTGDQSFHYEQKGAIATGVDRNPNMIRQVDVTWVCKPV